MLIPSVRLTRTSLIKAIPVGLATTTLLLPNASFVSASRSAASFSTSSSHLHPLLSRSPASLRLPVAPRSVARFHATAKMGSDASKPDGANLPKGKTDAEWRTVLSPAQFKVLREAGTERAFTHEFETNSKAGVYNCAACQTPLYKSTTKFKSGCGWPAFFDAIPGAVRRLEDRTLGMKRIEIRCAACDSHLGHVFQGEGFNTPTDERHCVNGISLGFDEGAEGKM